MEKIIEGNSILRLPIYFFFFYVNESHQLIIPTFFKYQFSIVLKLEKNKNKNHTLYNKQH